MTSLNDEPLPADTKLLYSFWPVGKLNPKLLLQFVGPSFSPCSKLKNNLSWGVNFINILHTNFSYKHCFGSFFYVHVTKEKLPKQCSYKKNVRNMLMKLSLGVELLRLKLKRSTQKLSFMLKENDLSVKVNLHVPVLILAMLSLKTKFSLSTSNTEANIT